MYVGLDYCLQLYLKAAQQTTCTSTIGKKILQSPVLAMLLANFALTCCRPSGSSNATGRGIDLFNEVIKDEIRKATKETASQD